jgi:hypothetical protein
MKLLLCSKHRVSLGDAGIYSQEKEYIDYYFLFVYYIISKGKTSKVAFRYYV